MTKKNSKKSEQINIPNTGRIDAIEEIETAAAQYVTARDAWMELQQEMEGEQQKLTDVLKKHGKTEYVFVDSDGVRRRAYIPLEAKAKVQKVKPGKVDAE